MEWEGNLKLEIRLGSHVSPEPGSNRPKRAHFLPARKSEPACFSCYGAWAGLDEPNGM